MKRLLSGIFIALYAIVSSATTLNPIQLLNPAGSTSGQAIVSTGASTAPAWGNVTLGGLQPIAANTVIGNATGSTASPTAIAVTGCNGAAQALQWTNGSGFGCNSAIATSGANSNITSLSAPSLGAATATTATVGTNTTQVATTAFVSAAQTGELLNVRIYTTNTTYTPTTGTNSIVVYAAAAGGGSGGNAATSTGQNAASGGGGAGAFLLARITSGFSGLTITIGAGGTAGAAGSNAGGTGGTTSLGTLFSCPGGVGGGGGNALSSVPSGGGSAGVGAAACTLSGITALINTSGQSGALGQIFAIGAFVLGGGGGSTLLGISYGMNGSTSPQPGIGYGSGASGMISLASASAAAGAAGAGGVIIIFEYR